MVDRYPEPFVSLVPFGESRLGGERPRGRWSGHRRGRSRYRGESWPLRGDHHLTLLSDGTLLARGPEDLLLGVDDGDRWVRVILEWRAPVDGQVTESHRFPSRGR